MKKLNAKIILSMIIGVMVFSSLHAADFHWQGSVSNDWNDPNNWAELSVPTSSDDVIFDAGSYDCLINCPTTIHSIYVQADFINGYQITIPIGCNLYISGNLEINVNDPSTIWNNPPNITLSGSNDQTITIVDYANWTLKNLTINKSGGLVTLNSYVKVITNFVNESGTTIINPEKLIWTCTPPQTGGIYHIANDFAL